MIIGSPRPPPPLSTGLEAQGVDPPLPPRSARPPISVLFASFLGYDPAHVLIGTHVLSQLPAANAAVISGRSFFPS
jgi:hypothetical protein